MFTYPAFRVMHSLFHWAPFLHPTQTGVLYFPAFVQRIHPLRVSFVTRSDFRFFLYSILNTLGTERLSKQIHMLVLMGTCHRAPRRTVCQRGVVCRLCMCVYVLFLRNWNVMSLYVYVLWLITASDDELGSLNSSSISGSRTHVGRIQHERALTSI